VCLTGSLETAGRAQPLLYARASATSRPEFNEALKAASSLPRLHSLIVSQRGTVVVEQYFRGRRATSLSNIKSASKSVIAALVGIAVDRKLLALTQPLGTYFRDLPDDKRAITIEDLLTMRSGLESTSNRNYGAWVQSANWVRYVLTRPLIEKPGTEMIYSTGNTHVLSAILTKVTGKSTWQYAQESLARPLGFTLAQWPRDPQGIYFGGNEMLMTPRQMLAFGELYLNGGQGWRPSTHLEAVHRGRVQAARTLAYQRPRVRVWLVDARDGRAPVVLCLGIRRAVHRARSQPRSRRRLDVSGDGE
jgi:CubicO group peptidase (beta-lactamase class C family)